MPTSDAAWCVNSKDTSLTFSSSACRAAGCLVSCEEDINNDMLILTKRLILISKCLATVTCVYRLQKCATQDWFLWYQAGTSGTDVNILRSL